MTKFTTPWPMLATPETGYGSVALQRACRAQMEGDALIGRGRRAEWTRMRVATLPLARYRQLLPQLDIELAEIPHGRMIGEHLAIRQQSDGRYRYREAQSVLRVPVTFADYLRGRHRQAVRTNTRRAHDQGLTVVARCELTWTPGHDDSRHAHISAGPVEKWMVLRDDGVVVADSIVSVDEKVALLHGLVSFTPYARWLLHTAIVERLCGTCPILLVNCEDAYLTSPKVQYFQRLLGYDVARLRVHEARVWRTGRLPHISRRPAARMSRRPVSETSR